MRVMTILLAVIALFVLALVQPAFAAGWVPSTSLSDSWDLGDIMGSFWTSQEDCVRSDGTHFLWTQLGTNINGVHKIDTATANFAPYYWYIIDPSGNLVREQHGYRVNEYISGRISTTLTAADLGNFYQQIDINARGLHLSEFSAITCYNGYWDSDTPEIRAQGGSNVALENFQVTEAYGSYNEWTYTDGGGLGAIPAAGGVVGDPVTYFNYNVTWHGDFVPGTLPSGFVVPSMEVSVAGVPEPSSILLFGGAVLGSAVGGLVWRRKR